MRRWTHPKILMTGLLVATLAGPLGCATTGATTDGETDSAAMDPPPPGMVEKVKYDAKTAELLSATNELSDLQGTTDEQKRRLQVICADYPDHLVCSEQTRASFAREAFCAESEFKTHIDEVVASCHRGQCKQIDQAELLTRTQYMSLVSHLPHTLVTFRAGETKLDRKDREQLQTFVEQLQADGGTFIIVGRASKDGSWKKNIRLALDRAEGSRSFLTSQLGIDENKVGYITYGHDKMYLTEMDADRLSDKKLSIKQANRSALIFAYPCDSGPVGGAE